MPQHFVSLKALSTLFLSESQTLSVLTKLYTTYTDSQALVSDNRKDLVKLVATGAGRLQECTLL